MTNDTFHEHDTTQRKQFRPPLARSNQRSRTMRYTGVKVNNYFMNHMGYNGSFAMFKKEVKKLIIENDVSLSCLWCLIDIIHWMYHCNLLYSETIVRKCSPETSGCVVVPSRYWFKYWLGQVNAWANVCLLTNERRTKGELRHILNIRSCIVNVISICTQVSMCSPVVRFTGLSITESRLVDGESLA